MNSPDVMGFHMISPSNVGLFMGMFRGIVDQFMLEIQPVKFGQCGYNGSIMRRKKKNATYYGAVIYNGIDFLGFSVFSGYFMLFSRWFNMISTKRPSAIGIQWV